MVTKHKSPAKSAHKAPRHTTPASTPSQRPASGTPVNGPVYAEPAVTPDPSKFKVDHPSASDSAAYKELDALTKAKKFLPIAFPTLDGVDEPILTLADALGAQGPAIVKAIHDAGRIVFHAAGDTGNASGPGLEYTVTDKLISDFSGESPAAVPRFFYHLGDIIYNFGEHQYYYDQFYDAFRDYPAPIFAIPGNHDGIVLPPPAGTGNPADSLSAYLSNFCTPSFAHSADAGVISRTTMIQPGPYFTLDTPLVRILGIYSNMLENPGVISSTPDPTKPGNPPKFPSVPNAQLDFLKAALTRVAADGFKGAVLIAVHHPPYTHGGTHSSSLVMLKEIDAICRETGVWPHAILSGHSHNYQRFTRTIPVGNTTRQIPFVVVGCGGHSPIQRLNKGVTIRTPLSLPALAQPEANDTVIFNSYDDKNYGYARILVDTTQLRIEYHPASDGATTKTPDDSVTVSLATGTLTVYTPPA